MSPDRALGARRRCGHFASDGVRLRQRRPARTTRRACGVAPESDDDPFGAEPIWLLREGVTPRPYNLDTLVIWTLLFGLLEQDVRNSPENSSEITELCQMLRDDLLAEDRWFLPLKGRLAQA